jgi:outer membrane protein
MKRFIILMTIIAAWVTPRAQTEASQNLTLEQAIELGNKYNTSLKNSALDVKLAEQKVREILSAGFPQINGAASLNDYIKSPVTLVPAQFFGGRPGTYAEVSFVPKYQVTASATASQLIFNGSYFLGVTASREYTEFVRVQKEKTQADVERDITKAYLTVLSTGETIKILEEAKRRVDKSLNDVTETYKQGLVEKLDVDRLKLTQSQINQQLDQAKSALKVLNSLLNLQIGYDVNKPFTLTSTLEDLNKKFSAEAYANMKFDVTVKPEYKIITKGLELQRLNVRANKMGYYPTLAGFGTYQINGQNNTFSFDKTYRMFLIGLQLNVPIFDGFSKDSKIRQASYTVQQYENNRQMVQNSLSMAYINAQTGLNNARRQMEINKQTLELAETVYNTTSLKYKEGVGNSFELTTAESELNNARIQNVIAQYNVIMGVFDLKTALGK